MTKVQYADGTIKTAIAMQAISRIREIRTQLAQASAMTDAGRGQLEGLVEDIRSMDRMLQAVDVRYVDYVRSIAWHRVHTRTRRELDQEVVRKLMHEDDRDEAIKIIEKWKEAKNYIVVTEAEVDEYVKKMLR